MIKINIKKLYYKICFKLFIYFHIFLLNYKKTYRFLSNSIYNKYKYVKDTISNQF
jgi:hypothetical protein